LSNFWLIVFDVGRYRDSDRGHVFRWACLRQSVGYVRRGLFCNQSPRARPDWLYEWVMSHMNESCYIWMSLVTYEWVMSHMNESCHIWMSHITHEWVMSYMNKSLQMFAMKYLELDQTCLYEWVMSHMNESCHTWMSHVTYVGVMSHMNESCHIWMSHFTYEWVISHLNESCHIWMSHVTYEWVMTHMNELYHIWISHCKRLQWNPSSSTRLFLACVCDMTHLHVRHTEM